MKFCIFSPEVHMQAIFFIFYILARKQILDSLYRNCKTKGWERTMSNILAKVILNLRNTPENQTFLFKDDDTYVLRNIYGISSGEFKSRSIPLSAEELLYLAEFINSQGFRDLLKED